MPAFKEVAVQYIAPNLQAWTLSDKGKRIYRKELIYVGDFKKGDIEFSVTPELIDHWVTTHDQMLAAGLSVPLPIEHTGDPEKNRGTVLTMERALNDKGIEALFGNIQFRDEDAEKLAATANVSIYVPPEAKSGKDVRFVRPIRHVALTDYPVIPGLDQFQAISASLTPQGETKMPLRELAKKMGLKLGDDVGDEKVEDTMIAAVKALRTEIKDLKKPPVKPEEKPVPTIAAGFLSMARENRTHKLDALVPSHISPGTRDKLVTQYCDDKSLTLSLSDDGSNDGFDALVETLAGNEIVATGEQTGPQALSLSHTIDKDKPNALIANAEAQAAAEKS